MKLNQLKNYARLCLAAACLGQASSALATEDLVIHSFDSAAANTGVEWGSSALAWDDADGNPAGALAFTVTLGSGSDTPMSDYICLNGNPWYVGTALNFSDYKSLAFDIKWDTNSDLTIDQFNNLATIPATATNSLGQTLLQGWAGAGYVGGIQGLEITLCGGPGGQMAPSLFTTNVPAAAASGWAHVVIPINQAQAQIDGVSGIVFHKWINQNWGFANDATVRFWIDNVTLVDKNPAPPPTLSAKIVPATKGLNVFASTAGLYDRQSAVLRQTAGLTWVGQASEANPVTYSFTIAGYPQSQDCEAWLFLVPNPNPAYMAGAPDWNETNCLKIRLQGGMNNGTMQFQYKVNEDSQQAMYSGGNETRGYYTNAPGSWDGVTANYLESGFLGAITNSSILGKWQIKFTSDTNVTMIAPDGNSTNFIFPAYNVGKFGESGGEPFRIYLGMQANNANALNQAVVYSDFEVAGTASPFSENFLADEVLDTTNTWNTSAASGPKGVLIVPANSATWVSWSLPDFGFSLQAAPTLSDALAWTEPSTGPIVAMSSSSSQLLATNELPAGDTAFFRLIKRTFTQLQVLLPGQTNAPGTALGYVGTPTPISLAEQGFNPTTITVLAVDDTFHVINGVTDSIHLTTTDGSAYPPNGDVSMVNGVATFSGANGILFQTEGNQTVTAQDMSSSTVTAPADSAAVSIIP